MRPEQRDTKTVSEANDEIGLVARAKSGSSSAFGQLYERYRLRIYNTTYRVLRQRQDAEDAAQRCFQRAFTNLARFREDSTFATWVTRIAINEALMMVRQRRSNIPLSEIVTDGSDALLANVLADRAPSPEQIAAAEEIRDVLTQAVSRLRKNLRSVVLLRELHGLTTEETARRLGLTVAAVKARIFHARRCLRRHLKRQLMPERSHFLVGSRIEQLEPSALF
ncbi:MAG TPA: sigma-70 family RNA polymerase sigma factor [Candidatus Acidoferrum sp.]|nr:sigma-70 family RNA polymerase sigma factor [Candidatus Acidoferrum sp.]